MATLDERGHEILDSTPIAVPVGFKIPESLDSQIRRFVRQELSLQASAQGQESFEEADDFDIEDDFDGNDPKSEWELNFDQESAPRKPEPKAKESGGDGPRRRATDTRSSEKWDGVERRSVSGKSSSSGGKRAAKVQERRSEGNDDFGE